MYYKNWDGKGKLFRTNRNFYVLFMDPGPGGRTKPIYKNQIALGLDQKFQNDSRSLWFCKILYNDKVCWIEESSLERV